MTAVLAQIPDGTGVGAAEFWVFVVVGALALGSAVAMVLMRNAVHGVLMLVMNFFSLAVLYAVLEAQFLAVIQIIVYAGAIMVLFLFVIMLLGVARGEPIGGRIRGQRPAALVLGVVLFLALSLSVATPFMGGLSVCGAEADPTAEGIRCEGLAAVNAEGNVRAIGGPLFTDYVWPFEVTSVLLVIAALGAIVLGRKDPPVRPPDERARVTPGAGEPVTSPEGVTAEPAVTAEEDAR